jgi:hypothetical protein
MGKWETKAWGYQPLQTPTAFRGVGSPTWWEQAVFSILQLVVAIDIEKREGECRTRSVDDGSLVVKAVTGIQQEYFLSIVSLPIVLGRWPKM